MRALKMSVGVALLSLAACGGGGGSAPAPITTPPPAPTPAPTPAPVPTPTPTPSTYDTVEYRQSNAAVQANALVAYTQGASGAGVLVATIDSGIDQGSSEFVGRISPVSQDVVSGRGIQDPDGHGTAVAAVLAAARNGQGIEGVAPQATLLVLRGETQGSCPKCSFSDAAIAAGINLAVANHARVINISLGGHAAGLDLTASITRATAAGVLIVIASGNEGLAEPDAFALTGLDPAVGNGSYIIAGGVDASGAISTFSGGTGANRAGSAKQIYLAALATRVVSPGLNGTLYDWNGTSLSAPVVSGAAALLAGAFPNLSGRQIADLLLSSADDAGAPGTDDQFGRGILNIGRAFAPKGTTALAGSAVPLSSGANAAVGGGLGDGAKLGAALSGAVVLDQYGRAYKSNLGRTLVRAPHSGLAGALLGRTQTASVGTAAHRLSLTVDPGADASPWLGLAQRGLDARGEGGAPRAGIIASTLWSGADMAIGIGLGLDSIVAEGAAGFVSARDTGFESTTALATSSALNARQRVGAWSFAIGADQLRAVGPLPGLPGVSSSEWRIGASHALGRALLTGTIAMRDERGGLLGATLAPAFGLARAQTRTLGLQADLPLGRWRLSGAVRHGWTDPTLAPGLIAGINGVRSLSWRLDFRRDGLVTETDSLAIRVAQPMRVVDGVAHLSVPDAYDYATLATHFANRSASLAPSGTEHDVEAVYARAFEWGRAEGHAFFRSDAEHITGVHDAGLALTVAGAF